MAELHTTSQWVQFFKDSGLPTSVSGNYAIIFVENRIQLDMLMDLSKEYLYDMGIRVMGDVIAILKHAKEYHTELTKQRMITDVQVAPQRNSPASRILGRLTKPSAATSRVQSRLSLPARAPPVAQTFKEMEQKPAFISIKKRLGDVSEVSVKRVRRVPPEEEGGYQIKMPSGSTDRTRKILQQQMKAASKISVFDRLGDTDVSSSTDIMKSKTKPLSSVFERLGSNSEVSTSTMSTGKNLLLSDQPLQYQGVLKTTTATRFPASSSKFSITRTVNPGGTASTRKNRIVFNSAKEVKVSSIARINKMLQERNDASKSLPTTGRIRLQSKNTLSDRRTLANRSVLSRLGTKEAITTTTTKTRVADRLGSKFAERSHVSVFSRLGT